MAGSSFIPTKTANTRVFLIEGRARGDHQPSYEYALRMAGVTQGFGDIEKIENPDPYNYGKYIQIGSNRGATERATTTLEGRYAMSLKSTLLELARKGCAVDVQLHVGKCTDPSDPNTFEKAIVLEDAYLTNWSTEDLGNLASGDEAVVNESADISAVDVYEILPMSFGEKAGSIVTNELLDIALCDSASCGDCEEESSGCEKVYAISKGAGGSPNTPPDIVFSLDGGITWYAHDIDTLATGVDPSGIACLGDYVVVVCNAEDALTYVLKSTLDSLVDPAWTEVTTGFVAAGSPNDIDVANGVAFICGDGGYMYSTTDPTSGVTVLDAGTVTVDNLNAVDALSDIFAVAVGNNGTVIYTANGQTFTKAAAPVGVLVNLNCVYVKSETEWWVGTSTGRLFYTINGGTTWTEKAFPGSGSGRVDSIVFSSNSIGFMAHATATPAGRILRTYDGGYSWQILPEKSGTLPSNDRVNALAVCEGDPNFVVGVGLGDNASDGFVVVGSVS